MNATLSIDLLPAEVALASRIVREGRVPVDLFSWLRRPKRAGKCPHRSGVLAIAIEEILGLLARDADEWISKELKHASLWYGYAIEQFIVCSAQDLVKRQVLTALLPLYRCLATRELARSFSLSRHRFAEIFFVAAMQDILGAPLMELLDTAESAAHGPDALISSQLRLSVGKGAGITLDQCSKQHQAKDIENAGSWLAAIKVDDFEHDVASWAEPPLLWRIAGEVIDRKPNKVLPRSWADIPVPWSSVTDHWRRIELEIDRLLASEQTRCEQTGGAQIGSEQTAIATRVELSSKDVAGQLYARERTGSADQYRQETQLDGTDLNALTDALEAELNEHVLSTATSANTSVYESSSIQAVSSDMQTSELARGAVACYSTAEVHNHNDPILANAVNRTIAVARKEGRSLSLATIVVLPDGDSRADFFEMGADGIRRWQSGLIANIATHPDMAETACFVTGDGEVIVTLLDLDRGLATELVRESLAATLSGGSVDGLSLTRAEMPVRFHVGIATTSRPGPNMSADELIAPSRRCFNAAALQGGAAIKSIEVY